MNLTLINRKNYVTTIGLFFLLFLAILLITPMIGPTEIDLGKALSNDIPFSDNVDANILFLARVPRIFLAALTGAAL